MSARLFSTKEAAEYLGLTVRAVKRYIYEKKMLKGTLVGHTLVFTQEELDVFNEQRRAVGRPKRHDVE